MTSSTSDIPAEAFSDTFPAFFAILRVLGYVTLALMLASIVYAGWIAIENWEHIRV